MYALVDCDNCFVSCERVFQPELKGRPVVVLSNNDGCVVARSQEAKSLGIKMGVPLYQIRSLVESADVQLRSSNYELYADLSNRLMSMLRRESPSVLVYSIDEAFLKLDSYKPEDYREYGKYLVGKIQQWIGLPVSIGIAPTKTLCKVAVWYAKHYAGYGKVCVIDNEEKRQKALQGLPASEVWGIGRKMTQNLPSWNVQTAWDFASQKEEWIKQHFSVTGLKTQKELKGIDCIVEMPREQRQTICTSRTFPSPVRDLTSLETYVSNYAGQCARKLRKEHSVARLVTTFAFTNPLLTDIKQYSGSITIPLETPANSDFEIIEASLRALRRFYREDVSFRKAGVIVDGITDSDSVQMNLFDKITPEQRVHFGRLSALIDRVNLHEGEDMVQLAVQQFPPNDDTGRQTTYRQAIRRDFKSNAYSTNLREVIKVK